MTDGAAGGGDASPGSQKDPDWVYRESAAEIRTEAVPYAHLSVQLGHLHREDFEAGAERLRDHFAQVGLLARAAMTPAGRSRLRVSTCVLVDDHLPRFSSPDAVVQLLRDATAGVGLEVDYLMRESGCDQAEGVGVGALLLGRLVPEPAVGSTGAQPPPAEPDRLSNGVRSPHSGAPEAMSPDPEWTPPLEIGARRHSVFLDTRLWHEDADGRRHWTAPFLSAVWQLLRLGLLRNRGEAVLRARPWSWETPPRGWDDLPPLVQLNPRAAPFCAYRTFSVLSGSDLPAAHAVQIILGHTAADAGALRQAAARSTAEGITLPVGLAERVEYASVPGHPAGGAA
ncbi:SCO2522 family protein [Streptomyces sp. NPDC059373]